MMERPSGDQAGEPWYLRSAVSSVAAPLIGSTLQIEPLMPTAIHFPSGDHAGAHGVDPGIGARYAFASSGRREEGYVRGGAWPTMTTLARIAETTVTLRRR